MTITVTGVEKAQKHLQKLANTKALLLEIARKLCEVGEPIIRQTHGNHAAIFCVETDEGYKLNAEGEEILFVEFGTGQQAGKLVSLYDGVPSAVGEGTWSVTHAQMYSRYGFWVFAGKIYHYTEPHPAFYDAYVAMVNALPRIAQEVFGT